MTTFNIHRIENINTDHQINNIVCENIHTTNKKNYFNQILSSLKDDANVIDFKKINTNTIQFTTKENEVMYFVWAKNYKQKSLSIFKYINAVNQI